MNAVKFLVITLIFALAVHLFAMDFQNDDSIKTMISKMTLDEKISMVYGARGKDEKGLDYAGYLPGIPRLGIPPLKMQNGPSGAGSTFSTDRHKSPATAFPVSIAQASTWNPELLCKFGKALGSETRAKGRDIVLAPSLNIIRIPEGGRNFEYISEDPYLASKCGIAVIKGIQKTGTMACAKHYAANNQETWRHTIDEQITERALREIYLPAFEAAVKDAKVASLMAAYNKINGVLCSQNPLLLTKIAKKQWNFSGFIMTDWGTRHKTVPAVKAGLDLEMSGYGKFGQAQFKYHLKDAVKKGKVSESSLDQMVYRILKQMKRFGRVGDNKKNAEGSLNTPEHRDLAFKMALEGIVLLKNDKNTLPLDPQGIRQLHFFGDDPHKSRFTGGGSSRVVPFYSVSPFEGIEKRIRNEKIDYFKDPNKAPGGDTGVVLIFRSSSETKDRESISLAEESSLINKVTDKYKKTILILRTPSAYTMPWIEKVDAVFQTWYPGQEEGNALAALLFGEVSPSGKLPVTFGRSREDFPAASKEEFPGINEKVEYSEGVFVGYRYFEHYDTEILFPFGYGLTYTSFDLQTVDINIENDSADDPNVKVSVKVINKGDMAGAEVIQLYVGDDNSSLYRPKKELKAFKKVFLKPEESKTVTLDMNFHSFAFWNPKENKWATEPGRFTLYIGNSSKNIAFTKSIVLK